MFEWTVFRISEKGDGKEQKKKKKKCDEIPSHIELHLSRFESTKNQFRFNQQSGIKRPDEIYPVYRRHYLMLQNKNSGAGG